MDFRNDWQYITFYVVGASLFFATGGLIGGQVERARRIRIGSLARYVVNGRAVNASESAVGRMAEVIAAITPVLTFIGSIIAAYLAYKSAMGKN